MDDDLIVVKLKHCNVHFWRSSAEYYATHYPDGTFTPSAPVFGEYQYEQAEKLGYGTDRAAVVRFWRDHDLLHTITAEQQGLAASPTLWAVAHDGWERLEYGVLGREEVLVPAVQQWLQTGYRRKGRMDIFSDADLEAIRQRLRAVLEPLADLTG
jgi:hypothetical protein